MSQLPSSLGTWTHRSRSTGLFVLGLSALLLGTSANAAADDGQSSSSIDLDFFKTTHCSATQIYHALERVAPDGIAKIKSGPIGSRRQKWLLNWLIRTREASDAGAVITSFEDGTGGMFSDLDWRSIFMSHAKEISEDCPNES